MKNYKRHRSGVMLSDEYYRQRNLWIYERYQLLRTAGLPFWYIMDWLIEKYGAEFDYPHSGIMRILNRFDEIEELKNQLIAAKPYQYETNRHLPRKRHLLMR